MTRAAVLCTLGLLSLPACRERTGALSPSQETRFTAEGILRHQEDLLFRFTKATGSRSERREDRLASIVVTRKSVLIHKNAKVGLEITPRSRRFYAVERDRDRVRLRSGEGRKEEIWSFVPPDDATGWVTDIRAVISASESTTNR